MGGTLRDKISAAKKDISLPAWTTSNRRPLAVDPNRPAFPSLQRINANTSRPKPTHEPNLSRTVTILEPKAERPTLPRHKPHGRNLIGEGKTYTRKCSSQGTSIDRLMSATAK